jgi:ATP-dependent DNA helicase RecG
MLATFETLYKILQLEKEQGYRNRAVIGGLEKFIANWYDNAHREATAQNRQALVDEIVGLLRDYATITETAVRARVIDQVLRTLKTTPSQVTAKPAEGPRPERVEGPRPEPFGMAQDKPVEGPRPSQPLPSPAPPVKRPALDSPVTIISGISEGYAKRMARLGVHTIRDLLYLFPRRYDDYSALKPIAHLEYGEEVTIIGTVWNTKVRQTRGGGVVVNTIFAEPALSGR